MLVVDDDPDVREAVRDVLLEEGYLVATAGDGDEALHFLRGETRPPGPGVVLLDLMMPGKSGWRFLEEHARDPGSEEVPVLVVSGRVGARTEGLQAAEFLAKPVSLEELLAAVRRHAGGGGRPDNS